MIEKEAQRQLHNIELIASENYVSNDVLEAAGSILTNKYAEGYRTNVIMADVFVWMRLKSWPGTRKTAVSGGTCQCAAAQRITGKYGRIHDGFKSR